MNPFDPNPPELSVDVVASIPLPDGRRNETFTSATVMVATLTDWHRSGLRDIRLKWGTTPPAVRRFVERTLTHAGVPIASGLSTDPPPEPEGGSAWGIIGTVATLLTVGVTAIGSFVQCNARRQEVQEEQAQLAAARTASLNRTFRERDDQFLRDLANTDPKVRNKALMTLFGGGVMIRPGDRVLTALGEVSQDRDVSNRLIAVRALSRYSRDAVRDEALRRFLDDPLVTIAQVAQTALEPK